VNYIDRQYSDRTPSGTLKRGSAPLQRHWESRKVNVNQAPKPELPMNVYSPELAQEVFTSLNAKEAMMLPNVGGSIQTFRSIVLKHLTDTRFLTLLLPSDMPRQRILNFVCGVELVDCRKLCLLYLFFLTCCIATAVHANESQIMYKNSKI
jgi:hypothetical protein